MDKAGENVIGTVECMRQVGTRMTELMIRYGLTPNGLANKIMENGGIIMDEIQTIPEGEKSSRSTFHYKGESCKELYYVVLYILTSVVSLKT